MGILLNLVQRRRGRMLTNKERSWLRRRENLRRGKQEGRAQYEWRIDPKTRQPYDFSQRTGKRAGGKTPFFGSSEGFGLDYVQTRSINPPPTGYRESVPRPVVNRGGSTVNLQAVNVSRSELQQTRRAFPTGGTDQTPIQGRRSAGGVWDGIVRNSPTRKSYLTNRTKEPTIRDSINMRKEPYDFLS